MLCRNISPCAFAVNESASAPYSLDSALASRARIRSMNVTSTSASGSGRLT